MTTSKPCVFISYRRDDSGGWAGRLEDELANAFGSQRVFRDVKIPVGVDYQDHIEHVLDSCYVVVVVIGPSWTSLTGSDGARRLTAPDDLLRREIERALQRRDVEVIPVLVQRARMPAADELPTELRALARRQAIELSDSRWSHDMAQLTSVLRELLRDTTAVEPPPVPEPPAPDPPAARRRPERRGAIGTSICLIAVGAVLKFAVTATVAGISLAAVGTILIIAGVIRLVVSRPERREAIGTSICLIAVGAFLRFAVTASVSGISLETVGTILIIVGVIGLVVSLVLLMQAGHRGAVAGRERVIEREPYVDPYA